MKILFLSNVPSPYRVAFFNELGKYCDLTVLFEKKTSDERDKSWSLYNFDTFKGIILKGKSINTDTAICLDVIKFLKHNTFDRIICTNFCSPTGMLAIMYLRKHNIEYWLESDGGFAKDGLGIKEKIKRYFILGAKGYFSTSSIHDDYYIKYGADKNKILRYPFTSVKNDDILRRIPSIEEKHIIRRKLNLKGEKIILSVGSFIYRKGFDVLMDAAASLDKNIGIYLVGGMPTQEYIEKKQNLNLSNVHFVGYKSKVELKKYYMSADIFVHPTREDIWGLVVNEAMACGLPVITTNHCIAGVTLVENNKNGFIVEADNSIQLSNAIDKILLSPYNLKMMGENSLKKIREYTIEKMVERHLSVL